MRISSIFTVLCLFSVISMSPATAQETVKELAAKASAEMRLLTSFQTLERMTSQMNHFLIYSIQAERGGWGVLEFVETSDFTNSYVVKSTAEDVQIEVARASKSISTSKVATDDEIGQAESAVENLDVLVALAPEIAELLSAGDPDAAALLYREKGRPAHINALRNVQSGVSTTQKRLSRTLLNIRVAK